MQLWINGNVDVNVFRHATGNELRRGDWGAAVGFQLRWAVTCNEAQVCETGQV